MVPAVLLSLCLTGAPAAPAPAKALGPETITLRVGHKFSREEAHARVQMLVDYWRSRFQVSQSWSGDRVWVAGRVVGIDFRAFIDISDSAVACESTDPGGVWRNMARDYVNKKLRKYLHPQYAEL